MNNRSRVPLATLGALAFVGILLIFLILDQRHWWDLRDDYLFGYLVPLFVVWVLYERWPMMRMTFFGWKPTAKSRPRELLDWHQHLESLRAAPEAPRWVERLFSGGAGLMALLGFIWVLFAALYRAMEGPNLVTTQLLALALITLTFSGAFLFSDRRFDDTPIPLRERLAWVGLLVFPACIWLLSAPMFHFIERGISTFLLGLVASAVFFTFDFLGFSIMQEGNILVLPQGEVGVEDACSGIRSLMACLFAGSFLAAATLPLGLRSVWKKVLMVVAAMAFAFIMNIGRSLFLTAWAYAHGPEAIGDDFLLLGMNLGSVHDVTGFAVIVPVVGALLLLLPLFHIQWEREMDENYPQEGRES